MAKKKKEEILRPNVPDLSLVRSISERKSGSRSMLFGTDDAILHPSPCSKEALLLKADTSTVMPAWLDSILTVEDLSSETFVAGVETGYPCG